VEYGVALAFSAGLFGGLHCLGMCSGLAGGLFAHYGLARRGLPVLAYHGARILTYVILGALGALLGRVLVQTGLFGKGQGLLMILAGLVVTVLGVRLLDLLPRRGPASAKKTLATAVVAPPRPPSLATPLAAGVVNGLVPCSLVFSVAIKAAATADPGRAALLMLAFGLGTLPMMLTVSLAGAAWGSSPHRLGRRLAGVAVIALGLWTLYEGLVFFDVMRGLGD
jgi:hypothetical protein